MPLPQLTKVMCAHTTVMYVTVDLVSGVAVGASGADVPET